MPRHIVFLPLVLLALGAAACGSTTTSSSPAPSAASSQSASTGGADAICAAANTKINALPAPSAPPSAVTDASQLPPYAAYLDQLTPLAVQEQTELAAAPDGAPLTESLATAITKLQAMDAAAKGTDPAAFVTASNEFGTAIKAFQAAGQAANLPNCAK